MHKSALEPIAIIGIGCRFPGGIKDPKTFWQLLINGVDAITEVPKDRFDINAFYDPKLVAPGKIITRSGGFMILFVPPEQRGQVREGLKNLVHVPFRFEGHGSQIIFYDPDEDFSGVEKERATLPIQEFRELDINRV